MYTVQFYKDISAYFENLLRKIIRYGSECGKH